MRERLLLSKLVHAQNRITPAYAGKTQGSHHTLALFQDHPRVCGKDLVC